MTAIYPTAVKSFQDRVDYTELVEAGDVNVAYDEIAAIETTLGVLPQNDFIDNTAFSWPTVGARMTSLREGVSKPVCNVSSNNFPVAWGAPGINTNIHISWTSKTIDTHSMATGMTLTCPRSGFYTFGLSVRWHKDGQNSDWQQPVFDRNGKLQIALQIDGIGDYIAAETGYFPIGYQKATYQSTSMSYLWQKGQTITADIFQSCMTTGITASAICSVIHVRDPATTGNL